MLPMARDPAKSNLASSSTLWAQASKEWVIPAKPKPGRKPKKDAAPPKEVTEVDSKGRRVQNRAAQRAFRERKQSQLAELQARVQSYEQGEIERNVALQQIAKRLKEENEQLKKENAALKDELAHIRKDGADTRNIPEAAGSGDNDVRTLKRWREESIGAVLNGVSNFSSDAASRKRMRADTDSPMPSRTPVSIPSYQQNVTYMASPPSLASSPDSNAVSGGSYSPLPFIPHPAPSATSSGASLFPNHHSSTPTSTVFPHSQAEMKSFDALVASPPFDGFDCGLCSDNTPCVCREIAMQQAALAATGMGAPMQDYRHNFHAQLSHPQDPPTLKVEDTETSVRNSTPSVIEIPPAPENLQTPSRTPRPESASPSTQSGGMPSSSILDNLPAYQPAVPLRRAATASKAQSTLYEIRLPSPEPAPAPDSSSRLAVPSPSLTRRVTTGSVWTTVPANSSASVTSHPPSNAPTTPMCSGDPSNCPACKDDDFGKAFCRALEESACSSSPCASCPNPEACGRSNNETSTSAIARASDKNGTGQGEISNGITVIQLTPARPDHQRSLSASALASSSTLTPTTPVSSSFPSAALNKPQNETIPANEAWARLKSHPAIAFADLSMLADVVARRTKCSGPVTVIHPAPGTVTVTPERDAARSPAVPDVSRSANFTNHASEKPKRKDDSPVLLTDPHAHYKAQEQERSRYPVFSQPAVGSSTVASASGSSGGPGGSGPLVLVPQEELRECGRRLIREVDVAGVREALRILDAQFGRR